MSVATHVFTKNSAATHHQHPSLVRTVLAQNAQQSPASGVCVGGRRSDLTILKSDLRGFTHWLQDGTRRGRRNGHQYLFGLASVIFAHHGTIDKFRQFHLAVFGSPDTQTRHHEDALPPPLRFAMR